MKFGGVKTAIFSILFLFASALLTANDHYQVVNGPKEFYYGHVSYVDPTAEGADAIVTHEGKQGALTAVLNLPIGPGDTIRTSSGRRCEIQFDSGTIVRLDFDTELKIETILAKSLSANASLSNLALNRGRIYVMYKEYAGTEMFQVLTPRAAVKLRHSAVAIIAADGDRSTETQVKTRKADVLFGPSEKAIETRTVSAGKRLIVGKNDKPEIIPDFVGSPFERWNQDINARFLDLHEGRTPIPKPIERFSPAVRYFAQTYGNLYGEWIWDDLLGYVWKPFTNEIQNPGTGSPKYTIYGWEPSCAYWQPYYYGQWTLSNGQMFWVPQEPWGWVPYHLGVWHWSKKLGWIWIPGSAFSPAWADWQFFYGFGWGGRPIWLNSWTPISVYTWMWWGQFFADPAFRTYWELINQQPWLPRHLLPFSGDVAWPRGFTMPCPVSKTVVNNILRAIKAGDPRIREEFGEQVRRTVFANAADLNSPAIHQKALTWEQAEKSGLLAGDPQKAVLNAFVRNEAEAMKALVPSAGNRSLANVSPAPLRSLNRQAEPASRPVLPANRRAATSTQPIRFRDWNPDLGVARRFGYSIQYLSRGNQVFCPELNLSSRDRLAGARGSNTLYMHAMSFSSGGTVSSRSGGVMDGSSGSGSGSSGGTSTHDPAQSGASHPTTTSSSGAGSGTVKK